MVILVGVKENRTHILVLWHYLGFFKIMEKHAKFINNKSYGRCDISVDDQTVHSLFNFSSNTERVRTEEF